MTKEMIPIKYFKDYIFFYFSGLTTNVRSKNIIYHDKTNCLVMLGSDQQLQFFDPIEQRQKFALEAITENVILGERTNKVRHSILELFDMNSDWIATIEKRWDNVYNMKLWKFHENNFILNTAIRDVHASEVKSIKFISREMVLTCGTDGIARLWKFIEQSWILLKAFNYLKLIPICGISSHDNTVLAISYGPVVIIYNLKTLEILSTLVSKNIQDPCTTLTFGLGQHASKLLCATSKGVFIWDLLSLRLIGQMDTEQSLVYSNEKQLILFSKDGLFKIEPSLKSVKISLINDQVNGLTLDQRNQRLYYVDSSNSMKNVLKYISLSKDSEMINQTKPEEEIVPGLGLRFNQLTVNNLNEDIFYARNEAQIVPDMITQKVSNCSEMIIKRMLPR